MNLGAQEIFLVFVIVLIVLGPRRIPEIARFLSKMTREMRKAIEEIKRGITEDDSFEG